MSHIDAPASHFHGTKASELLDACSMLCGDDPDTALGKLMGLPNSDPDFYRSAIEYMKEVLLNAPPLDKCTEFRFIEREELEFDKVYYTLTLDECLHFAKEFEEDVYDTDDETTAAILLRKGHYIIQMAVHKR